MNDTDRKIVDSLREVDPQCCLTCRHACEGEGDGKRHCTLFGSRGREESDLSPYRYQLENHPLSVCDLWEIKG